MELRVKFSDEYLLGVTKANLEEMKHITDKSFSELVAECINEKYSFYKKMRSDNKCR